MKSIPPLTITGEMSFKDVQGKTFKLTLNTAKHIVFEHKIHRLEDFIKSTLLKPTTIIESKHSRDCHLYYAQRLPDQIYRVVVVDIAQSRIKTAYWSKKIKGGEMLW